ncbi:hypothetical protein CF70_005185 [Cupriavidus sp. SK-3]|nr:hypothetical protein CF70_005185 [Cupriavidus sp. SK-3]
MNNASAPVKVAAPGQSSPAAAGSRDSRMQRAPDTSAHAAIAVALRNTERQPWCWIRNPASTGPNASPTPKVVPSKLKARVAASPSNSCASAAMPPDNAAAPATPCAARRKASQTVSGAALRAREVSPEPAMPAMKTRLRPKRSASAPAAIRQLPKLSIKALVTQLSAMGLPPRSSDIAGNATAGPVKLSGMASAARQTALRINSFCAVLRTVGCAGVFIGSPCREARGSGHVR